MRAGESVQSDRTCEPGKTAEEELGVSSQDNPQSAFWTYRMEVSPTGQTQNAYVPNLNDPVALLHMLLNMQSQSLELQKQSLEVQRQQLELARESSNIGRDQRTRQLAELERWQSTHESVVENCKDSLSKLESVHASLMGELTDYVADNHENLVDGDYALTDFVDRFGPRLAHLNTMLAILRPLVATVKKPEPQS